MTGYLRRLATTGAAYTASSVISKLIAVALLPLYTAYLTPADYGAAEVLIVAVIAASIVIRLGIIEALLRFYYEREEERALDREQVVRSAVSFLIIAITVGSLLVAAFAGRDRVLTAYHAAIADRYRFYSYGDAMLIT